MSEDYVEYRCIDNQKKQWHTIDSIKFAHRGRASNYVTEISYAKSRITQNGFDIFKGQKPAISIYKFIGNATFQQMKLEKRKVDREEKYFLIEDQPILYNRDFYSLDGDAEDVEIPSHHSAHVDLVPFSSPLRTPESVNPAPGFTEVKQESDTNGIVNLNPEFTLTSFITSPTLIIYSDNEAKESSGEDTQKFSEHLMPDINKRLFSSSKFHPAKPFATVGSNQGQHTSGNSSFLFMCAGLKTSLGKFAILASFLGWLGLVASTYGTALFYTAGALAVSGSLALGISLFCTSRTDAAEPKQSVRTYGPKY